MIKNKESSLKSSLLPYGDVVNTYLLQQMLFGGNTKLASPLFQVILFRGFTYPADS